MRSGSRLKSRVTRLRAGGRGPSVAARGFTLLELIVVVTMIGILAAIALPNLIQMPRRSEEAVLKTNLRTLREVLDQYNADLGYYPASLEALVEEGYLRKVPIDPITDEAEWDLVFEDVYLDELPETEMPETGEPGIVDVHSLSDAIALDGTPYNEW